MPEVDLPSEPETEAALEAEGRRFPWLWIVVALVFVGIIAAAFATSKPKMVEEVLVYRILARVDPLVPGDDERARTKIERVRKELMRPGTGFAAMALREDETQHSRSTDPGGLGWLRRGTLADPELELMLFNLKIDEISDIYKDEEGYSVFTITDRRKVPAR